MRKPAATDIAGKWLGRWMQQTVTLPSNVWSSSHTVHRLESSPMCVWVCGLSSCSGERNPFMYLEQPVAWLTVKLQFPFFYFQTGFLGDCVIVCSVLPMWSSIRDIQDSLPPEDRWVSIKEKLARRTAEAKVITAVIITRIDNNVVLTTTHVQST